MPSKEFIYEVVNDLGCLNEDGGEFGWNPWVKVIKYGTSNKSKLDIRQWSSDFDPHRMGKGVSLTYEQAECLRDILNDYLDSHDELS